MIASLHKITKKKKTRQTKISTIKFTTDMEARQKYNSIKRGVFTNMLTEESP
jgi:hypothetical protein